MENIITLQVVGFKNSGKTTLINHWVKTIKAAGLSVIVIKHHGHGANLAMPDERKDSMQYLASGADASIVSGAGVTQYMLQEQLELPGLMKLAKAEQPDIILIEGFKTAMYPKAILVKEEEEWEKLQDLSDIQLVVGLGTDSGYPQIVSREKQTDLANWLLTWIQERRAT